MSNNNKAPAQATLSKKQRFLKLIEDLNEGLYEREEQLKLAFLSLIAGESVFFLGPPGVAKSLISRKLKQIIKDGQSFEYLMNKFSTPEEIFGPISIQKLKNEDKYERIVENYLPEADIVFLDEIWKAGPAIQNSLLTVINEKIYRNGTETLKLPLKCLLAASNELPAEGEGLEALWDRFILRSFVDNIQDTDNFLEFLDDNSISSQTKTTEQLKIAANELVEFSNEIKNIKLSPEVKTFILNVIRLVNKYNSEHETKIYISDRRWKKIVKLLKTSAFINDRDTVSIYDCYLIKYCIWNNTEQLTASNEIISNAFKLSGPVNLDDINNQIADIKPQVKKLKDLIANRYYIHSGKNFKEYSNSDPNIVSYHLTKLQNGYNHFDDVDFFLQIDKSECLCQFESYEELDIAAKLMIKENNKLMEAISWEDNNNQFSSTKDFRYEVESVTITEIDLDAETIEILITVIDNQYHQYTDNYQLTFTAETIVKNVNEDFYAKSENEQNVYFKQELNKLKNFISSAGSKLKEASNKVKDNDSIFTPNKTKNLLLQGITNSTVELKALEQEVNSIKY